MTKPFISVVMPVYNNAPFLEEAVQSILHQTLSDFEFLILDDGSTDGSWRVIQALARRDKRIMPLQNAKNQGIACGLNRLIQLAQGEYIARMDGDDVALPQRFEKEVAWIKKNNLDFCGTWHETFGTRRQRVFQPPITHKAIQVYLMFQSAFSDPSIMAKAWVLKDNPYRVHTPFAEDFDLFADLSFKVAMGNIPEVLLRYRLHPGQSSRQKMAIQAQSAIEVRKRMIEQLGIPSSAEEKALHASIRTPAPVASHEKLQAIESWLMKLVGNFPEPELSRIIAEQWFRSCLRAAHFGLYTWRLYQQSSLRKLYGATSKEESDLFLLCLGRIAYRGKFFRLLESFSLS